MNALSRWVAAHGGWVKAPLPRHRVPDYTTIHFRLGHRWTLMRAGIPTRRAYDLARRDRG